MSDAQKTNWRAGSMPHTFDRWYRAAYTFEERNIDPGRRADLFQAWSAAMDASCHLEMRAAIMGAMKISDLWLPREVGPEHEHEAAALAKMYEAFRAIVGDAPQRNVFYEAEP